MSDTALLDCKLVTEPPSRIAACCVYSVQAITKGFSLGQEAPTKGMLWNSMLAKHTTYREADIAQMSHDLVQFVRKVAKNSNFQAFKKKYTHERFGEVACQI